jgi:hypothetical protein
MDWSPLEDIFKVLGCLAFVVVAGLLFAAGCVGYKVAHFGP